VQHAINAGERLIEAKATLRHGEWTPWLEQNFEFTDRTARNYMRLAANRKRVADLPTVREALAVLAEPISPWQQCEVCGGDGRVKIPNDGQPAAARDTILGNDD